MAKPGELTLKQQRFVDAYLVTANATQAAALAGYSDRTAFAIGRENIHKPAIAKAIEEKGKTMLAAAGVTPERLAQEYATIAFAPSRMPISYDHKLRALDSLAARGWPIPKAEAEKPAAITVTVVYENADQSRAGVKVEVEK